MDLTILSVVIIDDEQDAISLLEMYLRIFPFISVTGKESEAVRGLELVMETLPEIVFLDIDMPGMNGLQVADKIHSDNFYSEIVFTTAHQQYAYDALGIEPLDFLTKPFSIEDIESVIQKYNARIQKKKMNIKLDKFIHSQSYSIKIKFPTTVGILIVEQKDIVFLKSKANHCCIYLQDGSVETITRNICIVIKILNSPAFFQTNRSTYINLNYLQRIDKKNRKCIIGYNTVIHEVMITKNQINFFEKLNIYQNLPTPLK